jgi:acetyl esterase/lipase
MKVLVQSRNRLVAGAAMIPMIIILSTAPTTPQSALAERELPARTIPVPDTVSPQMQKLIAMPLTPTWNRIPTTSEDWKAQVNVVTTATLQALPALRQALGVKVEPITLEGVKAYMVTPSNIPPQNQNRLLLHLHGGCYVSFPARQGRSKPYTWQVSGISGSSRSTTACRPITHTRPPSMMR